ncbi:MAG TPA: acyltransferase [Bacteroidia bacterium]|jgi:peptidoglycan/LPS O-acetylase OafA/YrhL|nr:acyltransferase [Bacteroidia bacterium]
MGILRFILAISVLASHAIYIGIPLPGGKPYPAWAMNLIDGKNSVALFYIISGFYMAMVLNSKYSNVLKFYLNRFLRLWPTYIVALVLICIFTDTGSIILSMTANCGWTVKSYIWLSNIFIIGTDSFWLLHLDNCRLTYFPLYINPGSNGYLLLANQPSFSIGIEIIFYLMAPFILKSLMRTWLYFIIGVLYFYFIVLSGNSNIIYQYHFFPSSFIFFGLGALAWHYSAKKSFFLSDKKMFLFFIACLMLMFVASLLPIILILCFTFMVPKLFELTKNSKLDKLIGELSYPVYTFHFPVICFLRNYHISDSCFGLTCLSVTLIISIIIHFLVEKPIDRIRQRSFALPVSS